MTKSKLLDMESTKTDLMNRLRALNELQEFWSLKDPANKEEAEQVCGMLNQIIQRKGEIMAMMITGQREKKNSGAGAVAPDPAHSQEIPRYDLAAPAEIWAMHRHAFGEASPPKIFLRQYAGENYNDIPYVLHTDGYYRREDLGPYVQGRGHFANVFLPIKTEDDFDQLLNEDDAKFMTAFKIRG